MVTKNCGFYAKVAGGFLAKGKRKKIVRIKHNLEMKYDEFFYIIDEMTVERVEN